MTREEHKDEFFRYVAENQDELRHCLRKNITFDGDIFDDVTANTVIRIAEYIMRNDIRIDNFKNFFFIAAKREYINAQNKMRQADASTEHSLIEDFKTDMIDDDGSDEEFAIRIHRLVGSLDEILQKHFSSLEVDIFLIYYRLKSEKRSISYKKMASMLGLSNKFVTNTLKKIKAFVKTDHEVNELKKNILYGDDDD